MKVNVAEVWLAPGKSMAAPGHESVNAGHILDQAGIYELELNTKTRANVSKLTFDRDGLFGDREFMWVEAEPHVNTEYQIGQIAQPGQFLSQREDRVLTSISAEWRLTGEYARFSSRNVPEKLDLWMPQETDDNTRPVSVWGWNGFGVDQGNEAAEWGREVIGRAVRLVAVSRRYPRFVEGNHMLGRVGFADGFPLLVSSTASIKQVNAWLTDKGEEPVPANRFRANILLEGNLEPFEEDYIDRIEVVVNGIVITLRRAKACGRCPIPDTDQETGERKRSVRSVLGKNRRGTHANTHKYGDSKEIFFGQNFTIEMPPFLRKDQVVDLHEGDSVEAHMTNEANWHRA